MASRIFSSEEERYLLNQVTFGSDRVATKVLQWSCERIRKGAYFADASKFRAAARAALSRDSLGAKRWAMNALAELGARDDLSAIIEVLAKHADDPDLMVAGVAAVFSMADNSLASEAVNSAGIAIEGIALIAAAQHNEEQRRQLAATMIPLETEDCAELRAAIILAGTGKAPENLFHRTVDNLGALSELNLHHDSATKKYSVWGLAELRAGFGKLRLKEQDIESLPDEVRKWVFRLLFADGGALAKRIDMIDTVRRDPSAVVREEAAYELRGTYVAGIPKPIIKWLLSESHDETRFALLDHMASQSDKSEQYSFLVTHHYKSASPKSDSRIRIEAAAQGTKLYRELRKIELMEESGMLFANDNNFMGGPSMTVTQNFINPQIGAVTGSGNISAETIAAVQSVQSAESKAFFEATLALLEKFDADQRQVGERLVHDSAKKPDKSAVTKIVDWLKGAKAAVVGGGAVAEAVGKVVEQGEHLLQLM